MKLTCKQRFARIGLLFGVLFAGPMLPGLPFALAGSQGPSAKSPFEGTWVLESPLVPRPLEATFHVGGEEVTGRLKLGDGTVVPISAGKVKGANISFRFQGLNGRTLVAIGLLKGDLIEFELLLPGNEYGSPYTAKRK
jgi:hypothetical protein